MHQPDTSEPTHLGPTALRHAIGGLPIEDIYRRHGHMVLRRARTLLRDDNDARDVLQQVFLNLVDHPERFKGKSSVTTWLYRVTTNTCLNRLRDHNNRARLLKERSQYLQPRGPRTDAAEWTAARQFIDRMPTDLARVTVYHAIDGMTQAEIATVVGCSRRQVGNLLERAKAWAKSLDGEST